MKSSTLAAAILLVINMGAAGVALAQTGTSSADASAVQGATSLDSVIVTGTRGANRTQFDTLAPVDVFTAEDISAVESADLNDILAQLVPSFVVQRLPMNDGLVFVRPATLRGLSPDQTLVLVNGRRFHRSALLGARGAQAADLTQIPTSAVKRIEVLRDGASAQYGSDAIAGVINIILHDDQHTDLSVRASEYSEGDGAAWRVGARTGFGIGEYGNLTLFAEVEESDATSRSRQRPDAIAFQNAHPDLVVPNPIQRWGQPDLETQRLGFNVQIPLAGYTEFYGHGLFGQSEGVSDFNWRNPDGTASAYNTSSVFPGWDLRSIYPVGFVPKYGSEQEDMQFVAGMRGEFSERFTWDMSASYGSNEIDSTLANSINASLGPDSPTAFRLGQLSQEEVNFNADFVYSLPVDALLQPINVAFGAEYRTETFGVTAGDPASYAVGPGALTGLAPNSNGAPGFSDRQAGEWDQDSYAAYVDVEVPVTERWNVGAALRYEDFTSFGNTVDGKFSSRFEVTPSLAIRGSYSTGFRAPTPGQLNSTDTGQGLDTVTLQIFTSGRLSPDDPLAVLLGAKPLTPEQSETLSLGLAWQGDSGFSGSLDMYRIKVTDRFSQSASFRIPTGTPNPMLYTSVSYFTNDFDTTTSGIDLVGSYAGEVGAGKLNLTAALNYNKTEVDGGSTGVATNPTQRTIFEERLPKQKGTFTASYDTGSWGLLGRVRHYGAWTDSSGNATGDIFQRFGDMQFLDLALTFRFNKVHSLRVGADNVLDEYPDEATFQASRGLVYSRNAPYDTDGRNVYAEYRIQF